MTSALLEPLGYCLSGAKSQAGAAQSINEHAQKRHSSGSSALRAELEIPVIRSEKLLLDDAVRSSSTVRSFRMIRIFFSSAKGSWDEFHDRMRVSLPMLNRSRRMMDLILSFPSPTPPNVIIAANLHLRLRPLQEQHLLMLDLCSRERHGSVSGLSGQQRAFETGSHAFGEGHPDQCRQLHCLVWKHSHNEFRLIDVTHRYFRRQVLKQMPELWRYELDFCQDISSFSPKNYQLWWVATIEFCVVVVCWRRGKVPSTNGSLRAPGPVEGTWTLPLRHQRRLEELSRVGASVILSPDNACADGLHHRQWVVSEFNLFKDELDYTVSLLTEDPSKFCTSTTFDSRLKFFSRKQFCLESSLVLYFQNQWLGSFHNPERARVSLYYLSTSQIKSLRFVGSRLVTCLRCLLTRVHGTTSLGTRCPFLFMFVLILSCQTRRVFPV